MRTSTVIRTALMAFLSLCFLVTIKAQDKEKLEQFFNSIEGVEIEELEPEEGFEASYRLMIKQPVDHFNPDAGYFSQQVYLRHKDFSSPMVFVTEGYKAYGKHITELAHYLDANQITVEHRYFGKSVPDPLLWKYLNIEQAANDHHRIVQLFKWLYEGPWVNTGISKGGQTTTYHRYFFPEDVDASVGYVCPLNFSIEDQRIYDFMNEVGSDECRQKIYDFQKKCLMEKEKLMPEFKKLQQEKELTFSMELDAVFELTVMEYSFAFWQWGRFDCEDIPLEEKDPEKIMKHLDRVAGVDWVSEKNIGYFQPFYYQALTQIGFYGYDLDAFEGLITALKDKTFLFTCPDGEDCIYDPLPMEAVDHFVRHEADKMLFIYGEYDPWSAPSVQPSGDNDIVKIVKPAGSHGTRIRNLPDGLKEKALSTLEKWMGVEVTREDP